MPKITFHKDGETVVGEVKENTNLVVRAGIKQFPYPELQYKCGMGKCATCASRILAGAEHLPEPNWKEKKQLGPRIDEGWRLICQIWVTHDLELQQDTVWPDEAPPASSPTSSPAGSAPAGNAPAGDSSQ